MKIELCGMEFRANHGVFPEERRDGNDFTVDFRCEYPADAAAESDRIEDALDYSAVYAVIKREMAIPSNLLENVANRIAKALRAEFPSMGPAEIRIAKNNPPLGAPVACSAVRMTF